MRLAINNKREDKFKDILDNSLLKEIGGDSIPQSKKEQKSIGKKRARESWSKVIGKEPLILNLYDEQKSEKEGKERFFVTEKDLKLFSKLDSMVEIIIKRYPSFEHHVILDILESSSMNMNNVIEFLSDPSKYSSIEFN